MFQVVGQIAPPPGVDKVVAASGPMALFAFINNLFKVAIFGGSIFFIVQIISAGYLYINASGDSKKTEQAWTKIWQSILGIVIIATSFVVASIVEQITGVPILNVKICGPNGCIQ